MLFFKGSPCVLQQPTLDVSRAVSTLHVWDAFIFSIFAIHQDVATHYSAVSPENKHATMQLSILQSKFSSHYTCLATIFFLLSKISVSICCCRGSEKLFKTFCHVHFPAHSDQLHKLTSQVMPLSGNRKISAPGTTENLFCFKFVALGRGLD